MYIGADIRLLLLIAAILYDSLDNSRLGGGALRGEPGRIRSAHAAGTVYARRDGYHGGLCGDHGRDNSEGPPMSEPRYYPADRGPSPLHWPFELLASASDETIREQFDQAVNLEGGAFAGMILAARDFTDANAIRGRGRAAAMRAALERYSEAIAETERRGACREMLQAELTRRITEAYGRRRA